MKTSGFTPKKRKTFWAEWAGTLGFLAMTIFLVGTLFWNSNHTYPPRVAEPIAEMDRYSIVTDNGECWVVTRDDKGRVTECLFYGTNRGECERYIGNMEL